MKEDLSFFEVPKKKVNFDPDYQNIAKRAMLIADGLSIATGVSKNGMTYFISKSENKKVVRVCLEKMVGPDNVCLHHSEKGKLSPYLKEFFSEEDVEELVSLLESDKGKEYYEHSTGNPSWNIFKTYRFSRDSRSKS